MSGFFSTADGSLLDMVSPVNWLNPLNRGLLARYLCVPGVTGSSRFMNIAQAGNNTGIHTTLLNAPTWQGQTGRPGGFGSLRFILASSQWCLATATDSVPAYLSTSPLTLSCWFYPENFTATQGLITCTSTTSAAFYILEFGRTDNKFTYLNSSAAVHLTSTQSFTASQWIHVALVRTGVPGAWNLKLLINGVQDATASTATNGDGSATLSRVAIGAWNNVGSPFALLSGMLDDCCIWNRGLSDGEVLALYNDSKTGGRQSLNWLQPTLAVNTVAGGLPLAIAAYHYNHHLQA